MTIKQRIEQILQSIGFRPQPNRFEQIKLISQIPNSKVKTS